MFKFVKIILIVIGFIFAFSAKAEGFGDNALFYTDSNYDISARIRVSATLVKTTQPLYFYFEKAWWDVQAKAKQDEILGNLDKLSQEFQNKIYPVLTSVYGQEWRPGVDGDAKITVFFHNMKEGAAGYFREADEYIKLQVPDSNEKEMVYLSVSKIDDANLKALLAHEFVHLITYNQKNRILGAEEDVWLNEARAGYSSTMLGYDDNYSGSSLQKRVQAFLEKPSDSLPEWLDAKYDYGVTGIFTVYLVDHYSINMLADSLKSKLSGIKSINYALQKNGYKEDFSQIFTDWTIASVINDCSAGEKYCYYNSNLKSFRLNPSLNFLPLTGSSSLSVTNVTKNWSGNWQKIIGGSGNFTLQFSGLPGLNFKVPYIIFEKNGKYAINFLKLDNKQQGEIKINDFGSNNTSLIIIPSLQMKIDGFEGKEPTYPYTFTVSVEGEIPQEDQGLIKKLMDQIDALKKQIADILSQKKDQGINSCILTENLYSGSSNSKEIKCLQIFLKAQGGEIYPEGIVSGFFGNLTKNAVMRFQEKYRDEILSPLGLYKGSGIVGPATRQKINLMISIP